MLVLEVFGSENGSQGESFAALGGMAQGDSVDFAVVHHFVDSRHLAFAHGGDGDDAFAYAGSLLHEPPVVLAVQLLDNVLGQRDGGAAGGVELVDMVGLGDAHAVFVMAVHELCQSAVQLEHDVHADAEIRGHKESLAALLAVVHHGIQVVVPPSGAHHHGHVHVETTHDVAQHRGRSGELNSHVALANIVEFRHPIILVVDGHTH